MSNATPTSGKSTRSALGRRVEQIGKRAVREAIRKHLREGRAVYYVDPASSEATIIKKRPNGRTLPLREEERAASPGEVSGTEEAKSKRGSSER